MKLKNIFPNLHLNKAVGEMIIKGISDDSRAVEAEDLFFIIKRRNFDIFSILKDIETKVGVFVAEFSCKDRVKNIIRDKPIIFVDDIQEEFLKAVDIFYGFKESDLNVIGVTGTNGKTTTSFLIYYLLKELGVPVSLIGTVKYCIGTKTYKADYTTPCFLTLRKIFQEIKREGSRFIVMEISSHAIQQERIKGINFSRCVFTNLSRDHLDYHKTLINYFAAKRKLFFDNKQAVSLINIDDKYGKRLFADLPQALSYGVAKDADFRACNIVMGKDGSSFNLLHSGKLYPVKTPLCGRHNIYNILAALATISSLRFSLTKVALSIPFLGNIEGRLEPVVEDIFVDYAHTPEALETALRTLRDIGYENIICVFGCGGNRDKGKRKLMGSIASRWAGFTFITSDNPRHEDPYLICRQIENGFKRKNYSIIIDRKEAIRKAIVLLVKTKGASRPKRTRSYKACLLVAGKGHEDYQIIGSARVPFKDREVIREILKNGRYQNPKFKT